MTANTETQSVGEIDGFIDMLRAASVDRAVYDRLQGLLALPSAQRRNVVHAWLNEMIIAQAPGTLVQAIACLKSDTVATRAFMVLGRGKRPAVRGTTLGTPLFWILAALFAPVAFVGEISLALSPHADAPNWQLLASIALLPAAAGLLLTWGYRYLRESRQPSARLLGRVLAVGLLVGGALAVLSATQVSIYGCRTANKHYRNGLLERAIEAYSDCMSFSLLSESARADALTYRGASYARLGQSEKALTDQAALFQLRPPTSPRQYLDHAASLRDAGRHQEGLDAILAAERLPGNRGKAHLPYYKGWALYELGRYPEAIDVFNAIFSKWPLANAGYLPRGLSHEKLGDTQQAKSDYGIAAELFATLLSEGRWTPTTADKKYLSILREKLIQHDLLQLHPVFEHRTRSL